MYLYKGKLGIQRNRVKNTYCLVDNTGWLSEHQDHRAAVRALAQLKAADARYAAEETLEEASERAEQDRRMAEMHSAYDLEFAGCERMK